MKNLFKAFAFTAVMSGAFFACDTDPCKDVVCGDHGTCNEGLCTCETGYEKDSANLCNTMIRAKYLGANMGAATWSVQESFTQGGQTTTGNFTMVFTAASAITDVSIANFGDGGQSIVMEVTGSNTLQVKSGQVVAGFTVSGTGTLSGNTQTINYAGTNAADPTNDFTGVMTCTKQKAWLDQAQKKANLQRVGFFLWPYISAGLAWSFL